MFRLGYLQFRPRYGDVAGNRERAIDLLSEVEADLVVLPELAFTGYGFGSRRELRRLAEDPSDSETVDALVALCRRRSTFVCTGFAERSGARLFNSAITIGPRGPVHTYRKLHLFNDEKSWFDPGDLPLAVRRIRGARVGTMVCFDWAFPEVARTLTLEGAQVIAHPSNLVLDYCQRTMLTRCLENAVYAVTCNRHGEERHPHGTIAFTGRSQIVDPKGELVQRARPDRDALHVEELDPSAASDKKITARNHLIRDRRPAFYR
jgi:predicted amidohydrolase